MAGLGFSLRSNLSDKPVAQTHIEMETPPPHPSASLSKAKGRLNAEPESCLYSSDVSDLDSGCVQPSSLGNPVSYPLYLALCFILHFPTPAPPPYSISTMHTHTHTHLNVLFHLGFFCCCFFIMSDVSDHSRIPLLHPIPLFLSAF